MARKKNSVGEQAGLAITLAWVGGFVDAVGYMVLFKMFTAHMSGNTAAMGVNIGKGAWGAFFHRAFPIALFVAGVLVGAALAELLMRGRVRATFSATAAAEAVLLGIFMAFGSSLLRDGEIRNDVGWVFYGLAALPAFAMGMQNATLRRVGHASVRTTYITGMLTNLAEDFVQYLFWLRDHLGRAGHAVSTVFRLSVRQKPFLQFLLMLAIWTAYVTGAIAGAFAKLRWELLCLSVPIVLLALLAAIDLIWPVSLRKQHEPD